MSESNCLLSVWNDWSSDDVEYNDWYDREHIPQRLSFPGFIEASRYEAVDADRRYYTSYNLSSLAALNTAEYKDCSASPTPRTRKNLPSFQGMIRAAFHSAESAGRGMGGHIVCARRGVGSSGPLDLKSWVQQPGILKAEVWREPAGGPIAPSSEIQLRGAPDGTASEIIVVECLREGHAAIMAKTLSASASAAGAHIGVYRLMSRISGN